MLRAAATVVALLAALPAATPLLGGGLAFSGCRNLTHMGPGKWPDNTPRHYNFTGLLVMPGLTCSGFMVTWKHMVSTSLCRFWKGLFNMDNDLEEDGSEVRLGVIQGLVSTSLYLYQPVERYHHFSRNHSELWQNPVMIVELKEPFSGQNDDVLPAVFRYTPFGNKEETFVFGEVVGYEHSVNLPIYHQAILDARFYLYQDNCRKYGKIKWGIGEDGFCTWDVSPERTICGIDRGAAVVYKKAVLGLVVGVVDDAANPTDHCGVGRIHYNVFLFMRKYTRWITQLTKRAMIVDLVNGTLVEVWEQPEESTTTSAPPKRPVRKPKPPRRHRSGADQHRATLGPLLLAAAATVAHLASLR